MVFQRNSNPLKIFQQLLTALLCTSLLLTSALIPVYSAQMQLFAPAGSEAGLAQHSGQYDPPHHGAMTSAAQAVVEAAPPCHEPDPDCCRDNASTCVMSLCCHFTGATGIVPMTVRAGHRRSAHTPFPGVLSFNSRRADPLFRPPIH